MSLVVVFGSSGMLGTYVKKVMSTDFLVRCINRDEYDCMHDTIQKLDDIFSSAMKGNADQSTTIINCIGIIPQKLSSTPEETNYREYIKINTMFPHQLQSIAKTHNARLVHITTDCVFDGILGESYDENDTHTETNIYGTSKSLGEPPAGATVIRTSIIGEAITPRSPSLLEWVKSNKNNTIQGYKTHLWNGVTCLQLAYIIKRIIHDNLFWDGVRHIYSPRVVSKYDLCCYISKSFNLNVNVTPTDTRPVNKSLVSIYASNKEYSKLLENIPDICTQITDLKSWSCH